MNDPAQPAEAPSGEVTNRDMARGLGGTFLARFAAVIDIVAQPIYILWFGLASYGLYSVLWASVTLLQSFAGLGMTAALQRTVPQAHSEEEALDAVRAALLLGVGPCLLIAIAASSLAPSLAHLFNSAPADRDQIVLGVRLFAWALPLWAFVETSTAALRAKRLFGAEIRLRIFWEQVIRLPVAGTLYLAGFGIEGLFIAHLSSLFITCGLSVRLLTRHYGARLFFGRGRLGKALGAAFATGIVELPSSAAVRLYSDLPPIALNAVLPGAAGATAAALYTIARKVASLVYLVRGAFGYVLAPLASSAVRDGNENVRTLYAYATRLALALVLPLGAGMAAGAPIILDLFGSEAGAARPALVMLIAARTVEAIAGLSSAVLLVIGGYAQRLIASFSGLGVALCVGWLLVPRHGADGAAAAVAAGVLTASLLTQGQLLAKQGIHPFDRQLARTGVRALLIAGGAVLLVMAALAAPAVARPLLLTLIGLASIWLSARFALSASDRATLGKGARKLRLV